MNRRQLLATMAMAAASAMCGRPVPGPQPVALGHSTCAKCNGILYLVDGTGQAVYPDGTVRFYDDIGCMATHAEALRGSAQLYVQLAGSKGWARVEDVTFASPPNAQTVRGYNYFAYPEEEARQIAPDKWARGWNDLVNELAKKPNAR
ncbi:MAG: hypothetical protein NTY02_06505 [Acidobacteria bacterium]|nr:hypothetical protein [Acidobacteriota bacterium]